MAFVSAPFRVLESSQSCWCSPYRARHNTRSNIHVSSPQRRSQLQMTSAPSPEKLAVMVNGVPGKMASAVAHEAVSRGLHLVNEALTGDGVPVSHVQPHPDGPQVALFPPADHAKCLERAKERHPRLVVVDYTHPTAANPNVERYAAAGLSFVMGTTGGDEAAMRAAVQATSDVYAVIAPNMGKQIVAFQAMMAMMAEQFPAAFEGYTLSVTESHQANKADTSGTAKAVIKSFQKLGLDFDVGQSIGPWRASVHAGDEVPAKFVTAGHAFHTYRLKSPDGTVSFEFQHNVCGRGFYAAGTIDAVLFLDRMRANGEEKKVYDMIDILRAGSML